MTQQLANLVQRAAMVEHLGSERVAELMSFGLEDYSCLRATSGSTREARRAGM